MFATNLGTLLQSPIVPLAPNDFSHSLGLLSRSLSSPQSYGCGAGSDAGSFCWTPITDTMDFLKWLVGYCPPRAMTESSFGRIVATTNAGGTDISASPVLRTSFTYTGREWEEDVGLFYYRARWYDSSVGRFLQIDPAPGKLQNPITVVNKYGYVSNSPTVATDPSGKFAFFAALMWTAAGTGALSYIQAGGLEGKFNWERFRRLWEINFTVSSLALFMSGLIATSGHELDVFTKDIYSPNGFGVHVDGGSYAGGFSLGTTTANAPGNYSLGTVLHEVGHTLFEYAPLVANYGEQGVGAYIGLGLTSFGLGTLQDVSGFRWLRYVNPVTPLFEGIPDLFGGDGLKSYGY